MTSYAVSSVNIEIFEYSNDEIINLMIRSLRHSTHALSLKYTFVPEKMSVENMISASVFFFFI